MSARNSAAVAADRVLVITRIFDAPPRLVFKAWSSCEHMVHWMGPAGFTITLHQSAFESVESRDGHQGGWSQALDKLGAYVAQASKSGVLK